MYVRYFVVKVLTSAEYSVIFSLSLTPDVSVTCDGLFVGNLSTREYVCKMFLVVSSWNGVTVQVVNLSLLLFRTAPIALYPSRHVTRASNSRSKQVYVV